MRVRRGGYVLHKDCHQNVNKAYFNRPGSQFPSLSINTLGTIEGTNDRAYSTVPLAHTLLSRWRDSRVWFKSHFKAATLWKETRKHSLKRRKHLLLEHHLSTNNTFSRSYDLCLHEPNAVGHSLNGLEYAPAKFHHSCTIGLTWQNYE